MTTVAEVSSRSRIWLYLSIVVLLVLAAGVPALSLRDPEGWGLRFGMVLMTVGVALWLPLPVAVVLVPVLWLAPNYGRAHFADDPMFRTETLLELPGLIALAFSAILVRHQIGRLEAEADAAHAHVGLGYELDQATGVFQQRLLAESIERELVRSRRFGREFALMLAAIDPVRLRFDYRDEEKWKAGLAATAAVLLNTRTHIDRVFRFGDRGFALLLPETGARDIAGLIRRLSRAAKKATPSEGQPGGPLPLHFGVTFYPQSATAVEDLLKRAEIALRLADKTPGRVQLDGAEAPDMPAPELMRRADDEEQEALEGLSGVWLGAEAPEEEAAAVWLSPTRAVPAPGVPKEAPYTGEIALVAPASLPSAAVATAPLQEAVSGLVEHLEEALALIRTLKKTA